MSQKQSKTSEKSNVIFCLQ